MISIQNKITQPLKEWYWGEMYPIISKKYKKRKEQSPSGILNVFYEKWCAVEEDFFKILLLGSRKELEEKYAWVKDYLGLCDIISDLNWIYKKTGKYTPEDLRICQKKYVTSFLEEAIQTVKNNYRDYDFQDFPENEEQVEELYHELERIHNTANGYISQCIDYKFMKSDIRHELISRMDLSVCPYCNRIMVHTIRYQDERQKERMIPTADLDHFMPKSIYMLFSLSLWNFVPACKPCNQLFKRDKTARILSPAEKGFDEECHFQLDFPEDEKAQSDAAAFLGFGTKISGHWEIQPGAEHADQIRNNIEMFLLDEQYTYHENEIKEVLRKRYVEGNYHRILEKFLREEFEEVFDKEAPSIDNPILQLTESELNRLIYGVSLDPEKFSDEPLSKMIYDILTND